MSLPLLNASLNACAAVCLLFGLAAIKRGRRAAHERWMLSAFAASAVFLGSYLYYHFVVVPRIGHVRFNHTGALKWAYFVLLGTHVVLAIVNLPMVLRVLWLARAQRFEAHRKLARITFPIWMYVSVTGVLVYLALYVWNAPAP